MRILLLLLLALSAAAQHAEIVSVQPLTDDQANNGELSPDRTQLAFVDRQSSKLWLYDLQAKTQRELGNVAMTIPWRLSFSPDGSVLYFTKPDQGEPSISLFRLSLKDGQMVRLVHQASDFDVSPDGTQIVFRHDSTGQGPVLVVGADGKGERTLYEGRPPLGHVYWNRDGSLLTARAWNYQTQKLTWRTLNPQNRELKDADPAEFMRSPNGSVYIQYVVIPNRRSPGGPLMFRTEASAKPVRLSADGDLYARILSRFDHGAGLIVIRKHEEFDLWNWLTPQFLQRDPATKWELVTLKILGLSSR